MEAETIDKTPVQLEISISENEIYARHQEDITEPETDAWQRMSSYFSGQGLLIIAALILCGMIFILLSTKQTTPAPTPEAFTQITASNQSNPLPAVDLGARLNTIDLPKPGTVLQLGIFSDLEGAEASQYSLSLKGFLPHIEKLRKNGVLLYAVLLGPYKQAKNLSAIQGKLNRAKVDYYQRPEYKY